MDRHASGIGTVVLGAVLAALASLLLVTSPATAQDTDQNGAEASVLATEDYLTPPQEIMDAVLAPRHENYTLRNLDPSGRWFLRTLEDGLPTLDRFARPHHNLGAFQIDPAADRSRRLTTRSDVGFELISADGSERVTVDVPEGARVSGARWSPDGSRIAFLAHFDDATRIYVADTGNGDARRVTPTPLLATLVTGVEWTQDGRYVVAVIPPEGRGAEPERPEVPETPMVRVTTDEENRLRTYFDLLEDPYERRLAEFYATGQLARIDVESGDVQRIGEPAMIENVDVSPDGEYFRVEKWQGPFSYIVPTSSVASVEELWDLDGNVLEVLEETPLRDSRDDDDDDDDDNGQPERRGLSWRVDGPGMVYLQMEPRERPDSAADEEEPQEEEQEEGDESPRIDRVMFWLPPFDSTSTEVVYETEDRIGSVSFDATEGTLFLSRRSGGGDDARETVSAVFLDEPDEEHRIYSHRSRDIREDPGSLMRTTGPNGQSVVRTSSDGESVWLSGTRYFEEPMEQAPRPFIDRVEIRTGDSERVFESAADVYESVSAVLEDDLGRLIITRESPTMIEDSWLLDTETGELEQLTENVDHTPDLTSARREIVMITRPDGFQSKVEITLPADYRDGTRLPAMFWFYPREYTDQEGYENRNLARYNKNSFPGVGTRSMEILLRRGYAVVDPDLPVVGEDGQMNNNYVQDLRNTLTAVIDSLDVRGWIDRARLGIGGHSYGAFGTANAMVNTAFFKAGIAGDGNYNRSLTPAGFQTERRMLWEADQIYIEMSPFFKADQLTGALLMYHGMDDHNVGTHPTHSKRLFHALNVLGKKAGLYMYPFEGHGPATRETTLDLWARWSSWLDTYVKGDEETRVTTEDESGG